MKVDNVGDPQAPRKARQERLSDRASVGSNIDMQEIDIASLFGDPKSSQSPAENERRKYPQTGAARDQSGNLDAR
ncbi:hypothetical protein AYJ54_43385 [Bradyrhizobium centrolobii]|uniref:Uncharacterized protein n=1 Tax=Bradyrhizobium centrolobii TaxID=1505087 RepID=A0A176Z1J1_9BRAD|nr:hypothetical protein AYJ54_43385 [Bradyrhizobium centrolobii]